MKEQDEDVKVVFGSVDTVTTIDLPKVETVQDYLNSRGLSIAELQDDIHLLARSKGWYDGPPRNPLEMHMLIVSELAEATEEARKGTAPIYFDGVEGLPTNSTPGQYKPEGELIELADAVIRIMDYCGYRGWSLEDAIKMKHEYNKSRAYRHGGKKY